VTLWLGEISVPTPYQHRRLPATQRSAVAHSDLGLKSHSGSETTEMKKISVSLFAVWLIMLALHLLEGSYFDAIVRAFWHRLLGIPGRGNGAGVSSAAGAAVGPGGDRFEQGQNEASNTRANHVGNNPLHNAPASGVGGGRSSTSATVGDQAEVVAEVVAVVEADAVDAVFRPSADHTSHFPYHHRHHHSRSDEPHEGGPGSAAAAHTHSTTRAPSVTSSAGNPGRVQRSASEAPPVFNKRLFALKVAVALLHLCAYRLQVDSQYFVVLNAMVAVLPQTFEVMLEFADLRNRLRAIATELQLQEKADHDVSCEADNGEVGEKQDGHGRS
jgi:hypothetical protein